MKLRVKVNQAAAFRAGVDAPTSIIDIEVDPSQLSPDDRELIADRLDGIELYRIAQDTWNNERRRSGDHIVVSNPTLEGILAAVQADEKKVQDKLQAKEKEKKDQLEKAEKAFEAHKTWKQTNYVNGETYQLERPEDETLVFNLLGNRPEVKAWFAEISERNAKAKAAAEAKAEKRQKEREATKEKEKQSKVDIINRLGSVEQRERVARKYISEHDLEELATELLTEEAFTDCPLSELEYPSASDLDVSEWHGDEYDEPLPKVIHHSDNCAVTDELMKKILGAEKRLKAWRKDIRIQPWEYATTRDSDDIPWISNYGLLVSFDHCGLTCSKVVALHHVLDSLK